MVFRAYGVGRALMIRNRLNLWQGMAVIGALLWAAPSVAFATCVGAPSVLIPVFGIPFDVITLRQVQQIYAGDWRMDAPIDAPQFRTSSTTRAVGVSNSDATSVSASYLSNPNNPANLNRVYALYFIYSGRPGTLTAKRDEILGVLRARYGVPCQDTSLREGRFRSVQWGGPVYVRFTWGTGAEDESVMVDFWNGLLFDRDAAFSSQLRLQESRRTGAPF